MTLISEDQFQKKYGLDRRTFDFSNPRTFTKSIQALRRLSEDERQVLEELIWMWEENKFNHETN
jgi:hypothetical protein